MKLKHTALAAAFAILFAGCNLVGNQAQTTQNQESTPETNQQMSTESGEGSDAMVKAYTINEVSLHLTAEDCWIAIEGKVYDVSPFIADQKHPGGAAILQGCGKDGTELYNDRPNDSGAHSQTARSFLPNFYIGELSK